MQDLSTVPTATDRKNACDAAVAAQAQQSFIDTQEAEKQSKYQAHYSRLIHKWCSESDPNNSATAQSELTLHINNVIDSSVLDGWETDLESRGYTVNRAGTLFVVRLQE